MVHKSAPYTFVLHNNTHKRHKALLKYARKAQALPAAVQHQQKQIRQNENENIIQDKRQLHLHLFSRLRFWTGCPFYHEVFLSSHDVRFLVTT